MKEIAAPPTAGDDNGDYDYPATIPEEPEDDAQENPGNISPRGNSPTTAAGFVEIAAYSHGGEKRRDGSAELIPVMPWRGLLKKSATNQR